MPNLEQIKRLVQISTLAEKDNVDPTVYIKRAMRLAISYGNPLIKLDDPFVVLGVDGSRGDSICDLCVMDNCRTRKTADDLSIWNGSGLVMQYTGLEFGKVYTSEEFRTRAEKLYPHRTPKAQPMQ